MEDHADKFPRHELQIGSLRYVRLSSNTQEYDEVAASKTVLEPYSTKLRPNIFLIGLCAAILEFVLHSFAKAIDRATRSPSVEHTLCSKIDFASLKGAKHGEPTVQVVLD